MADALSRSPNGKPLTKGIGEDEVQVAVVSSSTADVSVLSLVPHVDPICVIGVTYRTEKDPLLRLLVNYLQKGELPEDIKQSRIIVMKAASYCIMDDILYFINRKKWKCRLPVLCPGKFKRDNEREPCRATGWPLLR